MTQVREPIKDSSVVKYWLIAPEFISPYLLRPSTTHFTLYIGRGYFSKPLSFLIFVAIYN
jgi:hypothetical protein